MLARTTTIWTSLMVAGLIWSAFVGGAIAQDKVGILAFRELEDAQGLGNRVRESLAKSFRAAGFTVVDVDNAAKSIPGAPEVASDGAKKLGQQTGVKWVVTGRVIGGRATLLVGKVLSTSSDAVLAEARPVKNPGDMDAALESLGEKLISNIKKMR